MIRNLKVLLAAAMALAAFAAVSAGAAQAAEEKFHCSSEPCTLTMGPDGLSGSATASQIFIPKNSQGETASFTCGGITGHATSAVKTTEDFTVTNLAFTAPCKVNGSSEVKVRMNECYFTFTSKGGGAAPGATVHLECPTAKHVEREVPETGCVLETTPQTLTGVRYHNVGTSGTFSTEITVEMKLSGLAVEVAKTGTGCLPKAVVGETLTATYNGNLLFTAERDNSNKEMVEGWWA